MLYHDELYFWSTHWLCLINVKKLTTDNRPKLFFACCCSKTSVVAVLLMFCREWWLLLLADNSTTTFLMLTGLHIHLSALRVCLGRFFMSLFQGHHHHWHRSFPPVVFFVATTSCAQMHLDFTPEPPSMVAWYLVSLSQSCLWITAIKFPWRKRSNKISRQRSYDANTRISAATQTTASNSSTCQI